MESYVSFAAYYFVLAVTCVYAERFGGWPERYGAGAFLSASLLTSLVNIFGNASFNQLDPLVLAIDLALLGALVAIALKSNRFWPLWVAGFHLVTVAVHLAVSVDRSIVPQAYATAQVIWAYPMLAALLLGCERCRRLQARAA